MAPLDLNTVQDTQQPIDLQDAREESPTLTPQIASSRANKAEFGLSQQTGFTYDSIFPKFVAGQERQFRNEAASLVDQQNVRRFSQGELSAQELERKTDPNSVIENGFAAEWMKRQFQLDDPWNNETHIHDAYEQIPDHVELTRQHSSNVIAIMEQLNAAAEEMEGLYKKQGWTQWGAQQTTGLIPFLNTLITAEPGKEELGVPFTPDQLILPGRNLREQSLNLYGRDPWDASDAIARLKERLKWNPGLAAGYFRSLAGMSTDDEVLQNQVGLVDTASVAGLGADVLKKVAMFNMVRRAGQDAIKEAGRPTGVAQPPLDPDVAAWENEGGAIGREPVSTSSARAKGDLETAAIDKVAADLVEEQKGKSPSMRRSIEDLTSERKLDFGNLTDDPRLGPDERELSVRLAASANRRDMNLVGALATAKRPDRTPVVETAKDVLRVAEAKLAEEFKGPDNQILDIDTRYDPITNTREHVVQIGMPGAKLFPKREVARANAEAQGLKTNSSGIGWERRSKLHNMIGEAEERLKISTPDELAMESEGGKSVEQVLKAKIEGWRAELAVAPPTDGYTIEPKGNGFYVEYTRPYREWAEAIDPETGKKLGYEVPVNEVYQTKWQQRKHSIWERLTIPAFERRYTPGETPYLTERELKGDNRFINALRNVIGRWVTPEETLAQEISQQKGIATHATNIIKQLYEPIVLSTRELKDLNRVLSAAQHWPDRDTGKPGYTFRTLPELNNAYMTHIHRLPTPKEVEGYFTWAWNNDLDLALRRIQLYIPKAIRGAEQFQFSFPGGTGKVKSGFVEGIERKGMPGGDDNILVVGDKGELTPYKLNDASFIRKRKSFTDKMSTGGAKVIEVVNPDHFPFRGLGDIGNERIRYVLVSGQLERKPLSLIGQLPRQGGGHLIPDYDWYGKQANIHKDNVGSTTRNIYLGDNTVMAFRDERTAREVMGKLDIVRKLMRDPDGRWNVGLARAKFDELGLPFTWKQFYREFFSSKHPVTGEKLPPRFSTTEPFNYVGRNLSGTHDTILNKDRQGLEGRYGKTFVNGTASGSIARTIHVEFSQERDMHQLMSLTDKGSRKNPIYDYQPAQFVDPLTAQNRGLARIVNSTMMNDVKIVAMNKWLKDAAPYLKMSSSEIWHSPYTAFDSIETDKGALANAPWSVRQGLIGRHERIRSFLGTPSSIDTALHHMAQVLADDIQGLVGPRLVPRWLLSRVRDPITFIRSATYEILMGMGSIKQFFTQWTAHSTTYALSPKSAPAATMASVYLHTWANFNNRPEILAELDRRATMMAIPGTHRFKPGEWLEAYNLDKRTGFSIVKEEHAFAKDNPLSARVVKSMGRTILDWGRTPFTMGASSVRKTALYSAYLEFRADHPTGRLTRGDEGWILDRARLLDHNMSRSSNSALHTGMLSIPGQFHAFDLRLAEIMWGKRISPIQKARLFAVSSILYGLPVGLGYFGFPLKDYITKKATEEFGYVAGDNNDKLMDFAINGAPSAIMNSITGHSYNVSKFGAQGIGYIKDILSADKTMLQVASGAAGTIFHDTFANSNNLWKSVMPTFLGGVPDMKPKFEYVLQAMRSMQSFDEAWKVKSAIYSGKWYSNNGQALTDDVGVSNAIFMGLTGMTENRFSQKFAMDEIMRDQNQFIQKTKGLIQQNIGMYFQALDENKADAQDYWNNASAIMEWAGIPPHEIPAIWAEAFKGHESLIRQTNERFINNIPPGSESQRLEQFRALENRDQK